MGKIFKQLARHWAACLAVVALLFVQAYCDLSLPDYTSKIVDTGIQQGGIESPLPETVRQSTLDALSLLMSEEDADALQNAYGYYLQDDGVLKLRTDLTDGGHRYRGIPALALQVRVRRRRGHADARSRLCKPSRAAAQVLLRPSGGALRRHAAWRTGARPRLR